MIEEKYRYGYSDIMIQPARMSTIDHRSQCRPFKDGLLPIFTAPMSTVVNMENYSEFFNNLIHPIIPRNIDFNERWEAALCGNWTAFSLTEFEEFVCDEKFKEHHDSLYFLKVVIDVANGNMEKIFTLSRKAREIHGSKIKIMSGNIANPQTYEEYCESGIDFVRVGIGGGFGCTTASNVAIHDGMASLLDDIWQIKAERKKKDLFITKVIADGGVRNYSDVIKALALGADYVMIGSIFAGVIESAAPIYRIVKETRNGVTVQEKQYIDSHKLVYSTEDGFYEDEEGVKYQKLYKEFYGMASKKGQVAISGKKTKTAEGLSKEIEVTTNLFTWVENMISYMRSAMSYCNVSQIENFNPENVKVQLMSDNVMRSINK